MVERCRVTVVVGLDAGGGKRLGRWLLVAHWRCTEAFDLSLSLSLSLRPSRLASSFSVSSFNSSFPSNSSGSLFLHRASPVPTLPLSARESPRTRTHTRESGRTPPSTLSAPCLLVWFRPRPPPFPPSPRHLPMFPFLSSVYFPSPFSPPPATLQSATTCIHPATKPPRLLGSTTINETVH